MTCYQSESGSITSFTIRGFELIQLCFASGRISSKSKAPGFVPPTTLVPYSFMRSAWKRPSRPSPWTITRVSRPSRTLTLSPAAGEIRIGGKKVDGHGMDRGVVFQDFAQLFPWRTALGNVEFGLRLKGAPADERRATVARAIRASPSSARSRQFSPASRPRHS